MKLYVIRRCNGWKTAEDLQAAAARSKRVGDDEMSADIRWIRSYVVREHDGSLGTVCIYQASSPEKIREHAARAGIPARRSSRWPTRCSSGRTRSRSRPEDGRGGRARPRPPSDAVALFTIRPDRLAASDARAPSELRAVRPGSSARRGRCTDLLVRVHLLRHLRGLGETAGMFTVAAEAYDRFMGRYSAPLAPLFAAFADVTTGQRVLDVGCGPGALTAELARMVGPRAVTAVDPSEPFVAAARARHPDVDVRQASAEALPFPDDGFDAALAQLVVHFMSEPVPGLREMARVTRKDGTVAACVWDHAGGQGPLSPYWAAVHELDPDVHDESGLAGAREGHLGELFETAGLREIEETALVVSARHPTFDEWWEPFELGVGPAGAYALGLEPERRAELRERCRERLPAAPFTLTARAWAARGLA